MTWFMSESNRRIIILIMADLFLAVYYLSAVRFLTKRAMERFKKHHDILNYKKKSRMCIFIANLKVFIHGLIPIYNLVCIVSAAINYEFIVDKIYEGLEEAAIKDD